MKTKIWCCEYLNNIVMDTVWNRNGRKWIDSFPLSEQISDGNELLDFKNASHLHRNYSARTTTTTKNPIYLQTPS